MSAAGQWLRAVSLSRFSCHWPGLRVRRVRGSADHRLCNSAAILSHTLEQHLGPNVGFADVVVKSDGSLWVILDGAPPERYNNLRSLAFAMAYYEQQNGGSPDDEQSAFDLFADLDLTGDLPDGLYEIEGQIVRYHSGRPEPV